MQNLNNKIRPEVVPRFKKNRETKFPNFCCSGTNTRTLKELVRVNQIKIEENSEYCFSHKGLPFGHEISPSMTIQSGYVSGE